MGNFYKLKINFAFLCLIAFGIGANAQPLTINTGATATQMAQAVIGLNGVVSGATIVCGANGRGLFSGGQNSDILIPSGTVLSTGSLLTPAPWGVNDTSSIFASSTGSGISEPWFNLYGGVTLTSTECCRLEFDVVPAATPLTFIYKFGSEEYNGFVSPTTSYGDGFAIFVSGAGIAGTINMAPVPGAGVAVRCPTINNGSYACNNVCSGPCVNCAYFVPHKCAPFIVYDGLTTCLAATQDVVPGTSYHLRMTITDFGDTGYDSGVFITTGSLVNDTLISDAKENCQDGVVRFRLQGPTAQPLSVHFTIGVESTAWMGIDYSNFPDSVVIPAGASYADVTIHPLNDFFVEPTETVWIVYAGGGCGGLDSVMVQLFDEDTINAGPDVTTCTGIPVQLGVPAAGGWTYSWSPTAGISDTTLAQPFLTIVNNTGASIVQDYILTGTFGTCHIPDTITVTIDPGPVANAGPDMTLCTNQAFVIGMAPQAGSIYHWSPSADLSDTTSSNPLFTSSYSGATSLITSYVLTADAGMVCLSYDTLVMTQNPVTPSSLPLAYTPVCGNDAAFLLTGENPVGGVYTGTGVSGGNFDPAISGGGSFLLTYTYTNAFNCISSDTATMFVNPVPVIDPSYDPNVCIGFDAQFTETGSPNIVTWNWTPSTFLNADYVSSPAAIAPSPAGTYPYLITVTDVNNCSNTKTQNLIVHDLPVVTITNPAPVSICIGNLVTLHAAGASTYTWSPTNGLSDATIANPVASPAMTLDYTVTGTDAFTCVNTADRIVFVNNLPVMSFAPMPELCVDAPIITLNEAAPTGGTYTGDGVNAGTFDPALATVGTHNILYSYTDPVTGCSNTTNEDIIVHPLPQPAFVLSPERATLANSMVSFSDISPDAVSWTWAYGDGDSTFASSHPLHMYRDTGTFTATMTIINMYGCKQSTTRNVIVGPDLFFFSPTGFTPNDDGKNDVFYGGTGFGFYEYQMMIFDRWGSKVFESKDQSKGWDGKNGADGVYVYKINLKDFDGKPYEYIGHISLVK